MSSTYDIQHNKKFDDLALALQQDLSTLTIEANGGRTLLFTYPPQDEDKYIEEAYNRLDDTFEYIDLRKLFVEFVDTMGWDEFADGFKEDGNDMFKSGDYDDTFLKLIIKRIKQVIDSGHNPVLIHTGCINGMGFTNIDYMEDDVVKYSPRPMVVFYPGGIDNNGDLMFLNSQKSSKYRCKII